MERYEINKYISQFKENVSNMYVALNIEKNRPLLESYEEKMSASDFWQDTTKANEIIALANEVRQKVNDYDSIKKDLDNILELDEMSEDSEMYELLVSEIESFKDKIDDLEIKVTLSGKYDNSNAILEIHPGAGGTEAMDWADMLFRMYRRYAERKGFKFNVLDYLPGDEAGIKSVTIQIVGEYAYGLLKSERGVHRLVRISPFNAQGKRQTSFASCEVAPELKEDNDIKIADEDLRIDTYCSSGPGGQGVNTTYSAVRITHIPTNIVVSCQQERSQIKNKDTCMRMLKSKLLELELQRQEEELHSITGDQMANGFGSQIRNYVFCPYTLVKDTRTGYENGNINDVMDGNIDPFITAYLKQNARG